MSFSQELFNQPDNSRSDKVITISQLNQMVSRLLDSSLPVLWVQGEISNLTKAASGHWYFSIKDKSAAVRAVMFRSSAQALSFIPELGGKYEFRVQASLYEPRGDFQVKVQTMRQIGKGDLYAEFLRLRDRLSQEGIINPDLHKPIPSMPRRIGVITSLKAAALQDVLSVLQRRAPHIPVIIYPSQVQGQLAAGQLIQSLQQAQARAEVDVILVVRGGGSIEDLWCFNDEALARLVAQCPIPIISGVGHETDFTIIDFVADLRAPTPTAAAELCCVSRADQVKRLSLLMDRMATVMTRQLEDCYIRLDRVNSKLVSPQQRLELQKQKLEHLQDKLNRAIHTELDLSKNRFKRALEKVLDSVKNNLQLHKHNLININHGLNALNPLAVLERGYSLVRDERGHLVKNALDLKVSDRIVIEFGHGNARAQVLETKALDKF